MGAAPRLARRAGTFYFRMAVPREWVRVLRRSEIKATLQTTDRARATFLCRSISNELDRLFLNRVLMAAATFEDLNKLIRDVFQDLIYEDYAFHLTFLNDKMVDNAQAHEFSQAAYENLKGMLVKAEIFAPAKQHADALYANLDFSASALRKDEALEGRGPKDFATWDDAGLCRKLWAKGRTLAG